MAAGAHKSAVVVGAFLREQYGIGWRDIAAKGRFELLSEVEHVPCNLCGSDDAEPIASSDKYGLPVTSVMCRDCGLMYLNPRPTAASYRRFYETGGNWDSVYHRRVDFTVVEDLRRSYYGADFSMSSEARKNMRRFMSERRIGANCKPLVPLGQRALKSVKRWLVRHEHGRADAGSTTTVASNRARAYELDIYEAAKSYVPVGGRVFEPGASWGRMLLPWKELHRCEVSGVEPKKESVRVAKAVLGIDLVQGFSDDPRIPENAYDLVLNTRTINHMLDPLGDLRHAWRWLKPGGVVFIDIPDAIQKATYRGLERATVEIDHPYMFTLNTLGAMVQKAGFEIIQREMCDEVLRDDKQPQRIRIHIFGRKSEEATRIEWSNYETERAALERVPPTRQRRVVWSASGPGSPTP